MTRRERLENKAEKRREWADKAAEQATRKFDQSHALVANIPMGQPILVGHHSEKAHRRVLDRSWNALGAAVEASDRSKHHESKAAGLEAQLEHNIFSDDTDAIDALTARIAEREAERDRMKKVNALYRKKDAAGLTAMGLERLEAQLKDAYSWAKMPYAGYELTNLGARIRTDKERLAQVATRQKRSAAAEAAPHGAIIEGTGDYIRVTFADKPDRAILNALRDAGYRWGGGSWSGRRDAPARSGRRTNRRARRSKRHRTNRRADRVGYLHQPAFDGRGYRVHQRRRPPRRARDVPACLGRRLSNGLLAGIGPRMTRHASTSAKDLHGLVRWLEIGLALAAIIVAVSAFHA